MAKHRMWLTNRIGDLCTFECPECGHVFDLNFANGERKEIVPAPNMYDMHVGTTTPYFGIGDVEVNLSEG